MKIKEGVKLTGMSAEILLALIIAQATAKLFDVYYRITITSVTDGKHGKGSLHYIGNAADIRSKDMDFESEHFVMLLREALGKNYDVINEKDHIHIEYQPK